MSDLVGEFSQHFKATGFSWAASEDVRSDNPNLLFKISGGVVHEAVLAGDELSVGSTRLASVQRCVRTDGLSRIGESGRHHVGFDMLGHFIFSEGGEVFTKELAIVSAWEFLTRVAGLEACRLHATAHPGDHVTRGIWDKLGVAAVLLESNVDTNPRQTRCGLRTEIVWRKTDGSHVELWNLVFTQFSGTVHFAEPLDLLAFDSGMSLDRLQAAVEDRDSNYDSSLWAPVIQELSRLRPDVDPAVRYRLADLLRSAVWMIESGVEPGKKADSYVLRKIIRQACLLAFQHNFLPAQTFELAAEVWRGDSDVNVCEVAFAELEAYAAALVRGERAARKLIEHSGSLSQTDINWLSGTHGYPPELSRKLSGACYG